MLISFFVLFSLSLVSPSKQEQQQNEAARFFCFNSRNKISSFIDEICENQRAHRSSSFPKTRPADSLVHTYTLTNSRLTE